MSGKTVKYILEATEKSWSPFFKACPCKHPDLTTLVL